MRGRSRHQLRHSSSGRDGGGNSVSDRLRRLVRRHELRRAWLGRRKDGERRRDRDARAPLADSESAASRDGGARARAREPWRPVAEKRCDRRIRGSGAGWGRRRGGDNGSVLDGDAGIFRRVRTRNAAHRLTERDACGRGATRARRGTFGPAARLRARPVVRARAAMHAERRGSRRRGPVEGCNATAAARRAAGSRREDCRTVRKPRDEAAPAPAPSRRRRHGDSNRRAELLLWGMCSRRRSLCGQQSRRNSRTLPHRSPPRPQLQRWGARRRQERGRWRRRLSDTAAAVRERLRHRVVGHNRRSPILLPALRLGGDRRRRSSGQDARRRALQGGGEHPVDPSSGGLAGASAG